MLLFRDAVRGFVSNVFLESKLNFPEFPCAFTEMCNGGLREGPWKRDEDSAGVRMFKY